AMISLDELRGEDGELTVRIGDKLEGHVISVGGKEGGLLISGRLQRGAGLNDQLRLAHQQGAPVQGLVTGVNKGGLDIDLGGVRAFLPASQIELRYCQDPSIYLGRALTLRVIRFDEESRTVVVSRRAVLEVEQRALSEQTRARLQVGARFAGVVVAMQEPTALVDLGGLDGSLPVSELQSAARTAGRAEDSIKIGQRVEVEVQRIEEVPAGQDHLHHSFQGNLRIAVALKGLLADPLDELLATLTEGQRVSGRVVRLEPFGAFIELTPGVEGLIHISAMAERHITHPREILALGQEITSTVISLDRDRRRIGLSLVEEARAAQAAVAATLPIKSRVKVRIERVESSGVLCRVLVPGVIETTYPRGMIPNAELNVPRGSELKKLFPAGREHIAMIQSIDAEGRVRLSLCAAAEPEVVPEVTAPVAAPVVVAPVAVTRPVRATAARSTRSARTAQPAQAATAEQGPAAGAPVRQSPAEGAAAEAAPAARPKAPRIKKAAASAESPAAGAASEPVTPKGRAKAATRPGAAAPEAATRPSAAASEAASGTSAAAP
ncbi:MAG TPA: S1 RNA-binding domain-containing protein, partial [Pseudomonadota bacterium]|nr:S1 RNA-binding domain-containing protein [Pseudomonadota bacterium]